MAVQYNYKKGIDLPAWQWLAPAPNASLWGTSRVYDGKRFMYWAIQYASNTTNTASTTVLYRYDTWSNAWQSLGLLANSSNGLDLEYDSVRNVLYITQGASLSTWQVFNLNTTSITIAAITCPPFVVTNMTPALPVVNTTGGSFVMPSDDVVAAQIDNASVATGSTTTSIVSSSNPGTFGVGMVGLQIRFTSGTLSGQRRIITTVSAPSTLVTNAFTAAPAVGDAFVIEQVEDVATAGSTTTVENSGTGWVVNQYANMDVLITSGTGIGQRKRIASNTATVLTLASASTGNPRTGAFATAPVSGSGYKIIPSQDFLYYQPGNSNGIYKIDVAQTTGAAWIALTAAPAASGGGANTFYPANYAPYGIVSFRGNGTATVYHYNIGLNTWSTYTTYPGFETFNTGASATMIPGKRKLLIQRESSTRLLTLDLTTGLIEPVGTMPYAAPATNDGKRASIIISPDGAMFLYILRAGGQEFFRVPLEWL